MTNIKQESITPPPGVGWIEPREEYLKFPGSLPAGCAALEDCWDSSSSSPRHSVALEDSPNISYPSPEPSVALDKSSDVSYPSLEHLTRLEDLSDIPYPSIEQSIDLSRQSSTTMGVKPLEDAGVLRLYRPASKRLLLFDYDGTLTDIVQDPSQALLGEPVLEVIQELASNPKNHVWIISGRDRDFLGKEFGHMRLGLVAEHGAFMRYPGSKDWLDKCESADMNWKEHVESKMIDYVGTAPGSFVERKAAALVCMLFGVLHP